MAYDLADVVPLAVQTRDATGALADATSVTCTLFHPGSSTTYTPAVQHPSAGNYNVSFAPVFPGRYSVRWVATSANASGFSDAFDVYDATPNYIVSLSDARELLRLTGTTQDELLRSKIAATTIIIERIIDEVVVPRTIVENITNVKPGRFLVLRKTPVISLTSLALTSALYTWDIATFNVVSETGVLTALPTAWQVWGDITVTYVAGRAVIPENVQEAAKIIIQHLWQTRRGTAGTPQSESMSTTLSPHAARGFGWGFAIPNAAIELLGAPVTGFA